ncbi:MAG: hypothetical protein O6943_06350 [Bacteroidetes bacterium]|nr:hypothetical protein [Bacteroidota bacterium]
MKKVDVLYLYEHVARELDVACAVKSIAEKHFGVHIELVHFPGGMGEAFAKFKPQTVLISHCYSAKNYHSILLEWRNSTFVNLSWEQLLSRATQEEKAPADIFAKECVVHQAWSDEFAEFLKDHDVVENNIFINGQPAYMLYKEPYRHFFCDRKELAKQSNLDENKRWIFFPENFWRGFYTDDEIDMLASQGYDRKRACEMRDHARASMQEIMQWCTEVEKYDDIELIIRPRPATPLNDFIDTVNKIIDNVPRQIHFIKDGSVREWILASDLVISSYSTSLVEAAIAGKAAYLLKPLPLADYLYVDWFDYIKHITTREEFCNSCLDGVDVSSTDELKDWTERVLLSRGDPIYNLAGYLAHLTKNTVTKNKITRKMVTKPGRLPLPKWMIYEYRKITQKKIRRQLKNLNDIRHECDQLEQQEINYRIEKWADFLTGYEYIFNRKDESK